MHYLQNQTKGSSLIASSQDDARSLHSFLIESNSLVHFLNPTSIDDIVEDFNQILTSSVQSKNISFNSSSISREQHDSSILPSIQDRLLNHLSNVLTSYRTDVQNIVQVCERKEWQLRKEQDILRETKREFKRASKVCVGICLSFLYLFIFLWLPQSV